MVTTYGPGAMIDLPRYSVIVTGLQGWSRRNREKVVEPRLTGKLSRILSVPTLELHTPPRHEDDSDDYTPVAARVFPTWFIVNKTEQSPSNSLWRRRQLVRWFHLDRGRFRASDGKRYPVVSVRFVRAAGGDISMTSIGDGSSMATKRFANSLSGWRRGVPMET